MLTLVLLQDYDLLNTLTSVPTSSKYLINAMEFILGILPFLTGVISAAFEKIQVSCDPCILSACVLSVAILYSRSGNAFLLSVQYFFREYGPSILHFPIIHLNMALTSPKDRNFQLEQIDKWRTLREKFCENQQLELKLLDQRDILDERRNPAGSLSPVEEAEYQSIKIQLSGIRPRLWENAQGFSRLRKEWVLGCWTLDFSAQSNEEIWKIDQRDCRRNLGCCGRSCGCCTRPRKGRNGRRLLLNPQNKMHCTIACSCCELWRNSY